jgi:hypothetical protein
VKPVKGRAQRSLKPICAAISETIAVTEVAENCGAQIVNRYKTQMELHRKSPFISALKVHCYSR